jgi:hypothetical protein
MLLAGAGATGVVYRATAQESKQGQPVYGSFQTNRGQGPRTERPQADDLESLRLEIDALRKELRAMRDRVKALEAKVERPQEQGGLFRYELVVPKPGAKGPADPLAGAEEALKRLRANPNDKQAAEVLERALKRLKEEGQRRPEVPGPKKS